MDSEKQYKLNLTNKKWTHREPELTSGSLWEEEGEGGKMGQIQSYV